MNTPENVAVVMQLIKNSTSPLGEFRLSLCIQKMRKNNLVGLFHSNSRLLDILLSRYKEHVSFWKIGHDLVRKELGELADLLGVDISIVFTLYDSVPQILWRQNAFECSKCEYVGPPGARAGCPKCGGPWKHAEAFGWVNAQVSLGIRIQNPKYVDDTKMNVTTVKTSIDGDVQETTIKRTMDGESADLQIKFRTDKDGNVELLHVHCQKDQESANWGKAGGLPIEKFFDISHNNGEYIIRCKVCGRRWSSAGRMENDQPNGNSPHNQPSR